MISLSLVDYLAAQLGCEYVSDLHFLDALDRLRLTHVVSKLSPDDWPLEEWNDALEYVANKELADNYMMAYDILLSVFGDHML